jgi:hypothetical protein
VIQRPVIVDGITDEDVDQNRTERRSDHIECSDPQQISHVSEDIRDEPPVEGYD